MIGRIEYPQRQPYWANQVQRALIVSEAVSAIGRDACWLVSFIAAREDMLRYSRVPKWWTQQLMDDSGFTNKRHFLKTRQAAIEAGWLVVNCGGKGIEGEYFTDIPVQFVGANSHQQMHQEDISRCEFAPESEPTNAPHPIPSNLITEEGAATTPRTVKKPKVERAGYPTHFDAVWNAYPPIRRKNKGKAFAQYQSAVIRVSEDQGCEKSKAAEWILQRVQQFSASHYGQKFAPEPERWFRDDRFHDAPEAWKDFKGDRTGGQESEFEVIRAIVKRTWSPDLKNHRDVETAINNSELFAAAKLTKLSVIADSTERDREIEQTFFKNLESVRRISA